MDTKNYQITIFNGLTGKIVNRHNMYNVTMEQAEKNAQKSREYFTWTTGTYCDAKIIEIK